MGVRGAWTSVNDALATQEGNMGKGWLLCACLALGATGQGADSLVVADSSSEAIYEREFSEGRGRARLVSGRINFLADRISIGSDRFVFYSVGNRIVEFDRTQKTLTQIYAVESNVSSFRMSAGSGGNLLALATVVGMDARIVRGTRTNSTSPWMFVDAGVSLSPTGDLVAPEVVDFAHLDSTSWVAVVYDQQMKAVVARTSNPGSPTFITIDPLFLPDRTMRVERGPGGQWLLYSTTNRRAAAMYSNAGTPLKSIPTDANTVFAQGVSALDWRSGNVGADYVTRTSIATSPDPLAGDPVAQTLHSFLGPQGGIDPGRDVSDAAEFRRRADGAGWSVAREGLGQFAIVDGATGEARPEFSYERGVGPEFGSIVDMAADGVRLFALCGEEAPQSILRVNRATGGRVLHATIEGEKAFDTIALRDDGEVFLSREEMRGSPPVRWNVVRRIASIDANGKATLETVAESPGSGLHFALGFDSQGRATIAGRGTDGSLGWREKAGALEPIGVFALTMSPTVEAPTTNRRIVSGEFDWFGSGGPTTVMGYRVAIGGTTTSLSFSPSGTAARIVFPDATTLSTTQFQGPFATYQQRVTPPYSVEMVQRFNPGATVPLVGSTRVEIEFQSSFASTTTWDTVEMKAQIPNATSTALFGDDLVAILHTPSRICTVDAATADATPVALSAADGFAQAADLGRIAELVVDPATGDVLGALREDARVVRIDRATGAVSEFVSGRAAELDADLLGFAGNARLNLAIAPTVEELTSEETITLY